MEYVKWTAIGAGAYLVGNYVASSSAGKQLFATSPTLAQYAGPLSTGVVLALAHHFFHRKMA
jgi:hypothetical protein